MCTLLSQIFKNHDLVLQTSWLKRFSSYPFPKRKVSHSILLRFQDVPAPTPTMHFFYFFPSSKHFPHTLTFPSLRCWKCCDPDSVLRRITTFFPEATEEAQGILQDEKVGGLLRLHLLFNEKSWVELNPLRFHICAKYFKSLSAPSGTGGKETIQLFCTQTCQPSEWVMLKPREQV